MDVLTILFRFLLTFAFSLSFGLERQYTNKPIGFGTYIFVSIGACGLSMAALELNEENPLPLLGAIITGIGFLGAGALIKTADKIFGFTSASSIWTFSIIGLTLGIGEYVIASLMFFIIWVVILIDMMLKRYGIGNYKIKVQVTTSSSVPPKRVAELLEVTKFEIMHHEMDKTTDRQSLIFLIEATKSTILGFPEKMTSCEWVSGFRID